MGCCSKILLWAHSSANLRCSRTVYVCEKTLLLCAAKFERAAKLNSLRGDWIAGYANLAAAGPKVVSVFCQLLPLLRDELQKKANQGRRLNLLRWEHFFSTAWIRNYQNIFRKWGLFIAKDHRRCFSAKLKVLEYLFFSSCARAFIKSRNHRGYKIAAKF